MAGETFIITGGGGALTGSVARVFSEAGIRLALVDTDPRSVEARAAELGALAVTADLTSGDEARRVVRETVAQLGRLDGLVHTAGSFGMARAGENDDVLYRRLLDANFRTTVTMVEACLPVLLAQKRGFVAGISSHVVFSGGGAARMSLYAAAKAALTFYLRSVATEVREHGVRIAVVYPMAAIDTPANRAAMPRIDPAAWVDPDEIARALLFAVGRSARGVLLELPIGVVADGGSGGEG